MTKFAIFGTDFDNSVLIPGFDNAINNGLIDLGSGNFAFVSLFYNGNNSFNSSVLFIGPDSEAYMEKLECERKKYHLGGDMLEFRQNISEVVCGLKLESKSGSIMSAADARSKTMKNRDRDSVIVDEVIDLISKRVNTVVKGNSAGILCCHTTICLEDKPAAVIGKVINKLMIAGYGVNYNPDNCTLHIDW